MLKLRMKKQSSISIEHALIVNRPEIDKIWVNILTIKVHLYFEREARPRLYIPMFVMWLCIFVVRVDRNVY
jgi:hypothetical protein